MYRSSAARRSDSFSRRSRSMRPTSRETLVPRFAASIRAQRAVSSSKVMVMFFIDTKLVRHWFRVNGSGSSGVGPRQVWIFGGRTKASLDLRGPNQGKRLNGLQKDPNLGAKSTLNGPFGGRKRRDSWPLFARSWPEPPRPGPVLGTEPRERNGRYAAGPEPEVMCTLVHRPGAWRWPAWRRKWLAWIPCGAPVPGRLDHGQ